MRVFLGPVFARAGWPTLGAVRVVDWQGSIRVQRSRALVRTATAGDAPAALDRLWREATVTEGGRQLPPGVLLLHGRHIVDLSGLETMAQALALASSELEGVAGETGLALIGMPQVPAG